MSFLQLIWLVLWHVRHVFRHTMENLLVLLVFDTNYFKSAVSELHCQGPKECYKTHHKHPLDSWCVNSFLLPFKDEICTVLSKGKMYMFHHRSPKNATQVAIFTLFYSLYVCLVFMFVLFHSSWVIMNTKSAWRWSIQFRRWSTTSQKEVNYKWKRGLLQI